MTEPLPDVDLNWMPFDAGVKFLSDRLMVNEATWVLKHWNCKYVDVRVDMRTGSMLIRPGNDRASNGLLPCPFCGGAARWCSDDEHECHLIVCGGCKISIDFQENPDTETLQELRDIMAAKWNARVSSQRSELSKDPTNPLHVLMHHEEYHEAFAPILAEAIEWAVEQLAAKQASQTTGEAPK